MTAPSPPDSQTLVFLDANSVDAGDIDFDAVRAFGSLTLHGRTLPSETADRIQGASIVLTNKVVIDKGMMEAALPGLKLIQITATGTNNVDLEAAKSLGITVCNVSGYSTNSVAQHAFALILNLMTRVDRYGAEAALWAESPLFTRLDYPVTELSGKTLGIIGLGDIGSAVAKIGDAFGMKVIGYARPGAAQSSSGGYPRLPHEEFFRESDVISLHCPLTPDTTEIIRRENLDLMKPTAILINTGRGGLVNEADLHEALKSNRIAGAGLDVLSSEPPPADNPLLDTSLTNLIVTPHTAWTSREARTKLMEGVVSNIQAFLDGSPTNQVA